MRLFRELRRLFREARKALREQRRQAADDRRRIEQVRRREDLRERQHGAPTRPIPTEPKDSGDALGIEAAMSGAFGESAGIQGAKSLHEVMAATDKQASETIAELDKAEQELREAGYLPPVEISK